MNSLKFNKLFLLKNTPIILLITVFLIFGFLADGFLTVNNIQIIATSSSYIGIIAVGMTFVLFTGGVDLSVGSNMYLSAVIAGVLINDYHTSIFVALVAVVCVGVLFGIINAFFILKYDLIPFVVTLSTMVSGRGLALYISKSQGISYPDTLLKIGSTKILLIPLPIIIFLIILMVGNFILRYTVYGKQLHAVGNDVESSKKAGINSNKRIAVAYIICGALAAVGGVISVSQIGQINSGFGYGEEFKAIAAAVLGGTSLFGGIGTILPGVLIGTCLIQIINSGLVFMQVDIYVQPIISSAIIFLAVMLDSMKKQTILKAEKRTIFNDD